MSAFVTRAELRRVLRGLLFTDALIDLALNAALPAAEPAAQQEQEPICWRARRAADSDWHIYPDANLIPGFWEHEPLYAAPWKQPAAPALPEPVAVVWRYGDDDEGWAYWRESNHIPKSVRDDAEAVCPLSTALAWKAEAERREAIARDCMTRYHERCDALVAATERAEKAEALVNEARGERDFERAGRMAATRERDVWMQSAHGLANGQDFYRDIVRKCGEPFGVAARTSDDGSIQEDVLALKVPELVVAAIRERDEARADERHKVLAVLREMQAHAEDCSRRAITTASRDSHHACAVILHEAIAAVEALP